MKRSYFPVISRTFVLVLALLLLSVTAEAQQASRVYRIGVLSPDSLPPGLLETFQERLQELGYVEGSNIAIESRHGQGSSEQLAAMTDELVRRKVDVILAVNTPAALAAKKATTTIPIVILRVADPVKSGLVPSLAQPGGNLTGLTLMPDDLASKQMQLLKEILPSSSRVAALWYAGNPGAAIIVDQMEPATARLDLQLLRLPVQGPSDFVGACAGGNPGAYRRDRRLR